MWSSATVQYLRIKVRAVVNGALIDPTGDVVAMGFVNVTAGSPSTVPGSWITAAWEIDTTTAQPTYMARLLVGPGQSFAPAANTSWYIWLKVNANPETPILSAGTLAVS